MTDIEEPVDDVVKITTSARQYSFKSEREKPGDVLSQALGAAVRDHDVKEDDMSFRFQRWGRWLQNGSLIGFVAPPNRVKMVSTADNSSVAGPHVLWTNNEKKS